MMTDREVAFVLNGIRYYGRAFNVFAGLDPDDADRRLIVAAKQMNIAVWLLEETRIEQQEIVEHILDLAGTRFGNGA